MPSFIGDQSNNRVLPNMLGGLKKATQQSSVDTYYDSSNNQLRVAIGAIASALGPAYATPAGSDYGLAVSDPLGNVHEVNPFTSTGLNGPLSTTSTSYVDLGVPATSFWVGASGAALIFISSFCETSAAGSSAECAIAFNGAGAFGGLVVGSGGTTLGVTSAAILVEHTGGHLNAGAENTAQPLFKSSDGNTVTFSEISLVVWPI